MTSILQIVIGAIVGTATISGLIFGTIWKITQDSKKSAHARITRVEESFNERTKEIESLAPYKYVDDIFVRKDNHSLEYNMLVEKIDKLTSIVEELAKKV